MRSTRSGVRNADLDLLQQSVPAFEASLQVFTPEAEPIRWATVANNLAASQTKIAEVTFAATVGCRDGGDDGRRTRSDEHPGRQGGPRRGQCHARQGDRLDSRPRSAAGLREANPLGWAMLQHTLATALVQRGEMNHSPTHSSEAADAYRAVLEVHTKDKTPAQWVRTTNNLAIALKKSLRRDQRSACRCARRSPLYQAVIEMTPRDQSPLDWADYQENLGNALAILVRLRADAEPLAEALEAYRARRRGDDYRPRRGEMAAAADLDQHDAPDAELYSTCDKSKALRGPGRRRRRPRQDGRTRAQPVDFFDAYLPQVEMVLGFSHSLRASEVMSRRDSGGILVHILVIGAAGMVGRKLIEALVKDGRAGRQAHRAASRSPMWSRRRRRRLRGSRRDASRPISPRPASRRALVAKRPGC